VNKTLVRELLEPLLSIPTAPFHEDEVARFIVETVRNIGLTTNVDPYGNVLVRRPSKGNTNLRIGFMAHMDHPGFEVLEHLESGVRAAWFGGVDAEYFTGAGIQFHAGGINYESTVTGIELQEKGNRVDSVVVSCDVLPPVGAFGTWKLAGPDFTNGVVRAPALDDVAGCGMLLAMLIELADRPLETEVWALFTRAEEVGFIGAIGLAKSGRLPLSTPVISVEMSRAMSGATQGMGPVIRLGDRSSVFDQTFLLFLRETAGELKSRVEGFKYQQLLMDGGSCEATALNLFGYKTAGLAVPLSNYHNQRPAGPNGPFVIDSEEIALSDFANAVDLCVAACDRFRGIDVVRHAHREELVARTSDRLSRLERTERARSRK
jgi:endoglucanase